MKPSAPGLAPLTRILIGAGLFLALAPSARADAQSDRVRALEQKLEASLQQIAALSARLAELERSRAAAPVAAVAPAHPPAPAPAVAPAQSQEIARLQDSVAQLSESLSQRSNDTGLPLHGFADVGAGWSSGRDPAPLRGFSAGTLDLYLTPRLGDRVKSLFEVVLEYEAEGGVAIDVERLQIGYMLSDTVTAWAGRFHTPFGLWNTSYHHGAHLQTSISRPRFIDFEDKGGLLPTHSIGLWGSGHADLGSGKLNWDAYVANGPRVRERTLDFNAYTDNNSNKMLGFNLGYSSQGGLGGLTLGAHGFTTLVAAVDSDNATLSRTRLRMLGGYVGYDEDDWEVIGEYYRFRNSDLDSGKPSNSSAWFMQVGKTFDQWTPYLRAERAALQPGDRYFASQAAGRSYRRSAAGLRYVLDPRAALKLEWSWTKEAATTLIDDTGAAVPFNAAAYRRAELQYAVSF